MTLIKKFLTASLPVALVGVVTPTIASCSCHKGSYSYEYKDHINCMDKSDGDYHKRKDIANAAKSKAYREARGQISLTTANAKLKSENGGRFAFNELIASIVITAEKDINLNNWDYAEATATGTCDLKYGDISIPKITTLSFEYVKNTEDNTIMLKILSSVDPIRSYAFYDCTVGE